MSSSTHHVVKPYTCRCRNITINGYDISPVTSNTNEYEQVFVGEDGIQIVYPYLTLRTRDHPSKSSEKSVQRLTLHCLECKTKAYRVVQDILPGLEAKEGPVTPNDGWVEQSIMSSQAGWIEVLLGSDGCLAGSDAIELHFRNLTISDTFSIAIPSDSSGPAPLFATPLHPGPMQDLDDVYQMSISSSMPNLSELPPLFSPPPFTPSHVVFQLLSTYATAKSTEWRDKTEELVKKFLKLQLSDLKRREEHLRLEVEAIWKNYRETWKEIMSQMNDIRPETNIHGDSSSQGSKRAAIPISIRDFSPIIPSEVSDATQSPPNHGIASFPVSSSITSSSIIRSRPVFGSLNPRSPSVSHLPSHNERDSVTDYPQLSSPGDRGELLMGAFKRNMDTSVDIATSLRWAEGEEALRKRFETKTENHRARKRTSKSLGITSADVMAEEMNIEHLPIEQSVKSSEDQKNKDKKQKRRVTFDIKSNETPEPISAQVNAPFTEELFDLDDFQQEELSPDTKHKPVIRNPVYKMRQNLSGSELQNAQAASLPSFANALKPFPSLHLESTINGVRRRPDIISLSDTLPLLSSSVPANDRTHPARVVSSSTMKKIDLPKLPETQLKDPRGEMDHKHQEGSGERRGSPIQRLSVPQYASGELELRNLFAASAPSHRHAWKEGGSAWKMLHGLNPNLHSPSVEDENGDPLNEAVSDSEDSLKHPAQLARSLPIEIHPPFQSRNLLEPKTSLADKQGILVPPLTFNKHQSSSAIRKAVYADRNLLRPVDPGPTLSLVDHEEIEEESPGASDDSDRDRGRRHALSILQAHSTVPEAGMWRSLAI